MKKIFTFLILCFPLIYPLYSQGGSDNAGNYGNAWSGNGGSGFSDWLFNTSGGGSAGSFLGQTSNSDASDVNGDGDSNGDGDINTGTKAWGMYANGGGLSEAFRFFNTDMIVNDRFTLDMDIGYVDGGTTVGFAIQRDDATNLLEIFFVGGSSNLVINDADGNTNSVGWSDEGFSIQIDITGLSGGTYSHSTTITQKDGGANTTKSGNFLNTGQVGKIRLFNANSGSGNSKNLYFNSLSHQVGALPIELNSFQLSKFSKDVLLTWQTASETNNSHFNIQKSIDNQYWESIGRVNGAGNSLMKNDYQFIDNYPNLGLNYYRLQQVDLDGNFEYSKVVSINYNNSNGVKVTPNPVSDILNISLDSELEFTSRIDIFSITGGLIKSEFIEPFTTQLSIRTSDLRNGIYWLEIKTLNGQLIANQKFVK